MKLASPALRALATAWYGVIPDDWGVERFKHLATIRNGQVDPEDPRFRDLPLFAPNHIESGTGRLLGVESADEQGAESGKYLVRQGEIVYSKIRPALRKAALAPCDGLCSADMYPVAPRSHADARFLLFEMLSEGFSRYSVLESDRVAMPKINRDALGECPFVFPDLPRQKAVATFLDRKTAAIDGLIRRKERLVELLQEKRQALITQAVTKGLDPNVPMKGSGIEWLGEIPAHWPVVRVSYMAKVQNGMTPGRDRIDYWEDGTIPWISSSQVNDYAVTSAREFITDRAIRETRIRMVPAGSVLVGLVGQGKTRGLSARMGIAGCINQNVAAITPGGLMDGRFLHLVLRHAYPSIRELGRGGQQDAMNCEIIRSLRVPMPPLPEQLRLIDHVDGQHAALDAVIGRVETHAGLLREYRQALISAAVTGKIEIPAEEAA